MPLNACIHDTCSNATVPGSVYCPGHHGEAMAKAAGVAEPEVEAAVRAVKSEDDLHPGMRKVYDRETGEPSWVPTEVEEALSDYTIEEAAALFPREPTVAGPLPVGPRIGPFPGEPWVDPREIHTPEASPTTYVQACLRGEHGVMRKSLAESMMEAAEWVLRKL